MQNRITLVTLFDKQTNHILDNLVSKLDKKICKVPYDVCDEKRIELDTLPYHMTISAWDKKDEEQVVQMLNKLIFNKIRVIVEDVKITNGISDSFVLYLSISEDGGLKELQRNIYDKLPTEKYNPDNFVFHITLNVDKDKNGINEMKKILDKNFKPFEILITEIGLFEIYPAKMIKKISFCNTQQ
jgi:2'-5' RNA ligase